MLFCIVDRSVFVLSSSAEINVLYACWFVPHQPCKLS